MGIPYAEVIGDPIGHSKSPLIHNFWLKKLGIQAEYRATLVRSGDLPDYFAQRREDVAWRGCNVTMPHKQLVPGFVDAVADIRFVDAANTVVRGAQGLTAYNTDLHGVLEPLSSYPLPPTYSSNSQSLEACEKWSIAQVIGAGGAALAATVAAWEAGYWERQFYNRTLERAIDTALKAGESRQAARPLSELRAWPSREGHPDFGFECCFLIINASPLGMMENPDVPIDLDEYPNDTIVFDMVYAPQETSLLRKARERNFRTIGGLQMLVAQAAEAFRLFFGQPAPREHDAELRELLLK